MSKDIATQAQPSGSVADLLRVAVETGLNAESMAALVDLQIRMRAEDARAAYFRAFAALQVDLPSVLKARTMDRGGGGKIAYASLDDVERAVRPPCGRHGFSYSWNVRETADGMMVECRLSHEMGHTETSQFPVRVDTGARMNESQKIASAIQYGKRNSLCLRLGVSTTDMVDDDAESLTECVTEQEAADLSALCEEVGADVGAFLKWAGVESFAQIRVSDKARIVRGLEAKRARG